MTAECIKRATPHSKPIILWHLLRFRSSTNREALGSFGPKILGEYIIASRELIPSC